MAHKWTWDKLAKNATRLNPKSRGPRYPWTPKWEILPFTSGPNRGQKVIVPFVGTKSVMVSLRAWGVTQAAMHKVTLLFSECEILKEDPKSENYFTVQYNNEMYWIKKFDKFKNPLTSRCTCFTGDTKVLLADGTYKTFKELEGQDNIELISYVNGQFIRSVGGNCNIKQYNAPIIKLTLQDGHTIKCTPDHVFFLEDGQTKEAKDLLNHYLLNKDGQKLQVVEIQDARQEDVYCLTVPHIGNFCLENGILVKNCSDFFYTWAFYNYHNGNCLYGPAPRKYIKKTNRPPRNPQGLVGICKHIYNAWAILRNSGLTLN